MSSQNIAFSHGATFPRRCFERKSRVHRGHPRRSGLMTGQRNLNRDSSLSSSIMPENNEGNDVEARTFLVLHNCFPTATHGASLLSSSFHRAIGARTGRKGGVGRRNRAVARSTIITITGNYTAICSLIVTWRSNGHRQSLWRPTISPARYEYLRSPRLRHQETILVLVIQATRILYAADYFHGGKIRRKESKKENCGMKLST